MSHNIPASDKYDQAWTWKSRPGYKPVLFISAAVLFIILVLLPSLKSMIHLLCNTEDESYK